MRERGTPVNQEAPDDPALSRSAAEESAAQRDARFRRLTEAIPVQVWTALPDGKLDYVSDQTARYFGRTVEEVVGDGWLSILHPDDVPVTVERWTHSLQTGESYETEFRLLSQGAEEYRWHLARAVPLYGEDRRIVQWFGTNTDIHEKKQAEAYLEQARLREHESNVAKSRFMNMLSHELRTPLGAIGGYSELLSSGVRGTLTAAQKADVDRIYHNQQHMLNLVNDLLELARLEARQLTIDVKPVALDTLLHAVLPIVDPLLAAKGVQLTLQLESPGLWVAADAAKAQQILINLIGNAIKFSPRDSRILVGDGRAENVVCITVADQGCGIDSEELADIFEAFVQVGPARQREGGSGLGLTISRELARAMSGDLRVESVFGTGSTFILELPLAETPAAPAVGITA